MKKSLIAGLAVMALAGGGIGATALMHAPWADPQAAAPSQLRNASFAVDNMTCATCPITVRLAMRGVDGVKDVDVDYDTKTATVRFDPNRATSGEIAAASRKAGYPATLIEDAL